MGSKTVLLAFSLAFILLLIGGCKPESIDSRTDSTDSQSVATYTAPSSPSSTTTIDDSFDAEESTPKVRDLEGQTLDCDVYSSKSVNTYTLEVEFEGNTAKINFDSGGYKYVDIDDADSRDLSDISCTDSDGETWEITVNDPPDISKVGDESQE